MGKDESKAINWKVLGRRLSKIFSSLKWPIVIIIVSFILSQGRWEKWIDLDNINYHLILDYVRTLAWPLIALITIMVIRPSLPTLIQNLRRLGGAGMSAEFVPPSQKNGRTELNEQIRESEDSNSPATDINPDTGVDTGTHDLLTSPGIKLAYNDIYELIYGSQLTLLKRLTKHIPDGLTADELQDIYESHTSTADPHYPSFISFVQFPIDNSLILYNTTDRRYILTNAGLYFLIYLHERGLYERFKPF